MAVTLQFHRLFDTAAALVGLRYPKIQDVKTSRPAEIEKGGGAGVVYLYACAIALVEVHVIDVT